VRVGWAYACLLCKNVGGAIVAWSGAVCAGAGVLAVFAQHVPWLLIPAIVIAVLAFVILLAAGIPDLADWVRERVKQRSEHRRKQRPRPANTRRWRATPKGFEVGSLMRVRTVILSHPDSMRPSDDKLPFVRFGTLVGCASVGPDPGVTELRARLRAFLSSEPVMGLLSTLSAIDSGATWVSLPGHGRWLLEAAMTVADEDQTSAPAVVAEARLLLPEADMPARAGTEPNSAELILHIEPRTKEGKPALPACLAEWQTRFGRMLELPSMLAGFLGLDLGLATSDDPPAKFALVMETPNGRLTDLVGIGDLKPLPGGQVMNQFMGWAIAEQDGKPTAGTARDLMGQLCEGALALDGYESALLPVEEGNG
jgi:hypothetical protein